MRAEASAKQKNPSVDYSKMNPALAQQLREYDAAGQDSIDLRTDPGTCKPTGPSKKDEVEF